MGKHGNKEKERETLRESSERRKSTELAATMEGEEASSESWIQFIADR